MSKKVFLNGEFVPPENAKVSVFDRGFLFADGVYEVIQIYENKFFLFNEHLQRLQRSLNELQIPSPDCDWLDVCRKLIENEVVPFGGIYIQVTRGEQYPRSHFWQGKDLVPFVMAFLQIQQPSKKESLQVMTYPDLRWKRCDIKTTALLPNVLARQEAAKKHCDEAILIKDDKWVNEGSASNMFLVKDQKVITPSLSENILPGITRSFCLELLNELQIDVVERPIAVDELYSADELWLTSATKDILPVKSVNGRNLASEGNHPLWEKVSQAFHDKKLKSLMV